MTATALQDLRRLTPGSSPSAAEQSLAEAILRRHTYREAFDVSPVPTQLLEQLRLAAEQEGARLHSLTDPDDVLELAAGFVVAAA